MNLTAYNKRLNPKPWFVSTRTTASGNKRICGNIQRQHLIGFMKIFSTIFIIILLTSCKTKTNPSQNNLMSIPEKLSLPKDSLSFYFPLNSFSNKPDLDSFIQNWYSSALYSFKEPHLSQDYVGHSIYRFLWLRSFHRPVVFTLHLRDAHVWLNTKMLDRQPQFDDYRIDGVPKGDQEQYIKEGYFVDKQDPDLLIRIADRKANIIYNKNISLSDKEWNEFEELLAKANFWKLPTNIDDGSTDGAQWVIEAHLKDKYHLVNYHSPYKNEYQKAGLFLLNLSGLKEEIY